MTMRKNLQMQVSHSRVECFKKCAYQYKLRYVHKLKTYFNNDPANPLVIGTALHTGIEKDTDTVKSNQTMLKVGWAMFVISFVFSIWNNNGGNFAGDNPVLQFIQICVLVIGLC